jgi:hypothetical protein
MALPEAVYPLVLVWLQAMGVAPHDSARPAVAALVTALLVGQSLRPTALMRALLSPEPAPARQRYKRVARAWGRPWLTSAWLTPCLVRAALALVAPAAVPLGGEPTTYLALDSVRCGGWEVFTLGVVWHRRVLPVAWFVLPYPWPPGALRRELPALVARVAAAWPAGRPAHLLADRAFPSYHFLAAVRATRWGWTLRLQAGHPVTAGGRTCPVRDLLAGASALGWTAFAGAAFGGGPRAVPGAVVVGRGLVVLPAHQRGEGSLRHRARRLGQRRQHVDSKCRAPGGNTTDHWVVLFTSHAEPLRATASYAARWATEGSYRDAQSGWDGQHGWDLEPVVRAAESAARVERVVGLWALGCLVQSWLGHAAGSAEAPEAVRATAAGWTVHGRLSVWARGKLALAEPSGRLRDWTTATLREGAERLAAPPALAPDALPRRHRRALDTPDLRKAA